MTFRNYLLATRPALPLPPVVHPAELQTPHVQSSLLALAFCVDDYDLAWQSYLTCGGFPRAVAEHHHSGGVSKAYMLDLAAWLRVDVDAEAPAESVPNLLSGLTVRSTSPLSHASAAVDLGYASRKVFELRLDRLVRTFAGIYCPRRDAGGVRVAGSQPKFYLTDPVLAWLPSSLRSGMSAPDMTALTEMTVGVALARAIDDLEGGRWVSGDTIGYARTASNNEIDLAPVPVPNSSGTVSTTPIESKWVDQGWRSEALTIEGRYHAGIVATKSILDLTHAAWAVPAPMVAALLG